MLFVSFWLLDASRGNFCFDGSLFRIILGHPHRLTKFDSRFDDCLLVEQVLSFVERSLKFEFLLCESVCPGCFD